MHERKEVYEVRRCDLQMLCSDANEQIKKRTDFVDDDARETNPRGDDSSKGRA